jgi:hypothetical protein
MVLIREFINVVLLISSCCQIGVEQGSVLTIVNGIGALNELSLNRQRQLEVEITADQLNEIKKATDNKKLFSGTLSQKNGIAKRELERILTSKQLDIVRKTSLRKRFVTPLHSIDRVFLLEIGMTVVEIDAAKKFIDVGARDIFESIDRLRVSSIKGLDELDPKQVDRLWEIFGSDLVVNGKDSDWRDIAVLSESRDIGKQLALAPVMLLPPNLELSTEQRIKLGELQTRELTIEAKSPKLDRRGEISVQLDSILTKIQRYAIVQRMQQQVLRADLMVLIRPELTKDLGLDAIEVESVKAKLTEMNREISRIQLENQIALLEKCAVPSAKWKTFLSLVDGVWTVGR